MRITRFGVILLILFTNVRSARILGVISIPSQSHHIFYRPLWKELSLKGHQVTVITSFPMNDSALSNLTEINMDYLAKTWENINIFKLGDMSVWKALYYYGKLSCEQTDYILSHQQVKQIINDPKEHFDLLMIEGSHTAAYAFAERFKCPFISMLSLDTTSTIHAEIGNPSHPVLHPDYALPIGKSLNFKERVLSSVFNIYQWVLLHYVTLPGHQLLVHKHFGNNYPLIDDIFRNYSAFFLNTNNIFHPIRPLLPNVIQIGRGMHIDKNKKSLPEHLQTILDKSIEGAIYFSLGSNAKSKDIDVDKRKTILDAFKELPYTILWKFEDENLPGKPDNVYISKWFPQQNILRHPNIKLFITQGGLQSMEEAIINHLPFVCIPVFGDQKFNVDQFVSKGFALKLTFETLTKENLKSTVLEAINNPRYKNSAKALAEIAYDHLDTGLDLALWWTEYVIRHKGATHLRNPGLDLPLYQYMLLDVISFCLCIFLIVLYLFYKLFTIIFKTCKFMFGSSKEKQM